MQTILNYKILAKEKPKFFNIEDLKKTLRINHNDDDELLNEIYLFSIEYLEKFIAQSIFTRKIELSISRYDKQFFLRHQPVSEIASIVENVTETTEEIDRKQYFFDESNGKIGFSDKYFGKNITINYIAGFNDKMPISIISASKSVAEEYYDKGILSKEYEEEISRMLLNYRKMKV